MCEYEIATINFKFGEDYFEKFLEKIGLEIKRVSVNNYGDGENLVYEVKSSEVLDPIHIAGILKTPGALSLQRI